MLNKTTIAMLPNVDEAIIKDCFKYIVSLRKCRGDKYLVQYLSLSSKLLENAMLDVPEPIRNVIKDKGVNIRICRFTGRPHWLESRLKSLSNDMRTYLRLSNTIINYKNLITVKSKTSLESITSSKDIDFSTIKIAEENFKNDHVSRFPFKMEKFVPQGLMTSLRSEYSEKKGFTPPYPPFYFSLKAGPNANVLSSRLLDSKLWKGNKADILEEILSITTIGYEGGEYKENLIPKFENFKTEREESLSRGKISSVYTPGKLKPRIFASADCFTQECLTPLHDSLMNILKMIPEDLSHDHNDCAKILKDQWARGIRFYGFSDLSDATDSIPKYLYKQLLNTYIPSLGDKWLKIVDIEFSLGKSVINMLEPESELNINSKVKYNTGQPMGFLSSWPAMALVHHWIVWLAAGSYRDAKGKYIIIGDDIVVFDKDIYTNYLQLLESLKIPYRSNISSSFVEFAKRQFYEGSEVTGVYLSALNATIYSPIDFLLEWFNHTSRGYIIDKSNFSLIFDYLKIGKGLQRKIEEIYLIPKGKDVTRKSLGSYTVSLTGRSTCHLTDRNIDAALKPIIDASALALRSRFDTLLSKAKANAEEYDKIIESSLKLTLKGEFDKNRPSVELYKEDIKNARHSYIRYLERDWKSLYTHDYKDDSIDISNILRPKNPNEIFSMSPKSKEYGEDKYRRQARFQAIHLIRTLSLLK